MWAAVLPHSGPEPVAVLLHKPAIKFGNHCNSLIKWSPMCVPVTGRPDCDSQLAELWSQDKD